MRAAISPDGEWVVFSRCNPLPNPGGWSLWKVPIGGGKAIQLTPTVANSNFYASWSPDGQTIFFQRQDANAFGDDRWTLWKVSAAGGTPQQVLVPPGSPLTDAVQPALAPDGGILLMGLGARDELVRNVITNTLDPTLASPSLQKVVPNYPDTSFAEKGDFPLLSPRLSPDGTRTALGSKQIWAARRNMNLPPRFTTATSFEEGARGVPDTAATMSFTFDPFSPNFITVLATDAEGDALTYQAGFLPSWMTWNPASRTLTAANPIPTGAIGKAFHVKFWVTTSSGGTDAFIAVIQVLVTLTSGGAGPSALGVVREEASLPPDVPPGALAVVVPQGAGAPARLSIFDLAGRRIATVRGNAGEPLIWERRNDAGNRVPTGVYLYRMEAGRYRQEGKFVVIQ